MHIDLLAISKSNAASGPQASPGMTQKGASFSDALASSTGAAEPESQSPSHANSNRASDNSRTAAAVRDLSSTPMRKTRTERVSRVWMSDFKRSCQNEGSHPDIPRNPSSASIFPLGELRNSIDGCAGSGAEDGTGRSGCPGCPGCLVCFGRSGYPAGRRFRRRISRSGSGRSAGRGRKRTCKYRARGRSERPVRSESANGPNFHISTVTANAGRNGFDASRVFGPVFFSSIFFS